MTLEPKIDQYLWKNTTEKPSRPEDFKGDIRDKVVDTLEAEKG